LVHHHFTDPEIVVEPLLHAGLLGEVLWFYTRTVSGEVLAWSWFGVIPRLGKRMCSCIGAWEKWRNGGLGGWKSARSWGETYVRPVERRTPARKADTGWRVSGVEGDGIMEDILNTASKA
jgi:hypothetical protein